MSCIRSSLSFLLIFISLSCLAHANDKIVIGSKKFSENFILAEMMAILLRQQGYEVETKLGMGGTIFCFEALKNGEIDIYPEYTGTLSQAILKIDNILSIAEYNQALTDYNLKVLASFGFNNTYSLVMQADKARQRNITTISDLNKHPDLKVVFSHEFLNRSDGWLGLKPHYNLNFNLPAGIEHSLAYQAMLNDEIDVTDAYSTDGELLTYDLVTLRDNLSFFPEYKALPLMNRALPKDAQQTVLKLAELLDEKTMQRLNARVDTEKQPPYQVARDFLLSQALIDDENQPVKPPNMWSDLLQNTLTHIQLSAIALLFATVIGISVSLLSYRRPKACNLLLYITGLFQTIPSIALLVMLIPWLGIGATPAIVALFLYALLPIVRNTLSGLLNVPALYKQVAQGMGLSDKEQLRYVLLPLALPFIISGVKTAAVISVGTTTLAAFIGAGGLGEPIVTGLALNNTSLILQGAIPAALLALATEWGFSRLEKRLVLDHLILR